MQYAFLNKIRLVLYTAATGLFLFACNNASNADTSTDSANTAKRSELPSDSATKAAAYSFIDACVESSKMTLGDEAKSFAHCKCMEAQIRQQFGNTDSLTVVNLQKDSAALARLIKQCR